MAVLGLSSGSRVLLLYLWRRSSRLIVRNTTDLNKKEVISVLSVVYLAALCSIFPFSACFFNFVFFFF